MLKYSTKKTTQNYNCLKEKKEKKHNGGIGVKFLANSIIIMLLCDVTDKFDIKRNHIPKNFLFEHVKKKKTTLIKYF